jgi:pimeloyl-ACP methyl ester carboxylesterase
MPFCFFLMKSLMMSEERKYPRPDAGLMLAEAPRVVSEIALLMSTAPFLYWAPRGDGHPVFVLPGFGASDRSTYVMRHFLSSLGYRAEPWKLGTNLGPALPDLGGELSRKLDGIFTVAGERKVSIVGWSLGGVYARMLAHRYPHQVRQVITLGSPFNGNPRSTSVYPIARRMGIGAGGPSLSSNSRQTADPKLPAIPSTAIFSKTDGVVPWQTASQMPGRIAENIEVYASHAGLGFNPTVLYAIADRLATEEGNWTPFERKGWKSPLYGPAQLEPEDSINPAPVPGYSAS